jgi:uncharacterized protein (DUF362 family)
MDNRRVFILKSDFTTYPDPPFHPGEYFPELNIDEIDKGNRIYGLVREALYGLGMDCDNFGTPNWNPLGEIVRPVDKVILKPNLVFGLHEDGNQGVDAMVTHASILRPVIDYVIKASKGTARITICDAPLQSASWEKIINENHYKDLVDYFRSKGINIELLDLRSVQSYCNKYGGIEKTVELSGDPDGNCIVDLRDESCFVPISNHSARLEITGYPSGTVVQHHNARKNEYLISRTVLEGDVFINLPKMKTHRKAGVTLSLKNVIGIVADKSWIAHHRRGSIKKGGDEFDSQPLSFRSKYRIFHYAREHRFGVFLLTYFYSPIKALVSNVISTFAHKPGNMNLILGTSSNGDRNRIVTEGSWYRNDTLWRTILDINRCLFYADSDGKLHPGKQRRYFTLIDGILGMDEEGPLEGKPKNAGCLVAAYNPVACDYVSASIMGVDPDKVPSIHQCFKLDNYKLIDCKPEEIVVGSNYSYYENILRLEWKDSLKFIPPKYWQGHIERKRFQEEWTEEAPRAYGFPNQGGCCLE